MEEEIVDLRRKQQQQESVATFSTTNLRMSTVEDKRSKSMNLMEMDPDDVAKLREELQVTKSQKEELKDQLQRMAIGEGIETSFIKEEEFANDKMSKLRQQTLKNLHDNIVEELSEVYEDLDDEEDSESDDDQKETESKSKFELLMDRV